jgi:hypothetical protein
MVRECSDPAKQGEDKRYAKVEKIEWWSICLRLSRCFIETVCGNAKSARAAEEKIYESGV